MFKYDEGLYKPFEGLFKPFDEVLPLKVEFGYNIEYNIVPPNGT